MKHFDLLLKTCSLFTFARSDAQCMHLFKKNGGEGKVQHRYPRLWMHKRMNRVDPVSVLRGRSL